jgi:Holliday junction resolvase RusA-like endonuclease
MRDQVEFIAYGRPAPQGSKKAFAIYKGSRGARSFTGKIAQVEMSKYVKPWRESVAAAALTLDILDPFEGPLVADMVFSIARPKSHYRTGRFSHLLRDSAPTAPACTPDLSKLCRATEDAMTGIVWKDDALVVKYENFAKVYVGSAEPDALDAPGAVIRVRPFVPAAAGMLPGLAGAA